MVEPQENPDGGAADDASTPPKPPAQPAKKIAKAPAKKAPAKKAPAKKAPAKKAPAKKAPAKKAPAPGPRLAAPTTNGDLSAAAKAAAAQAKSVVEAADNPVARVAPAPSQSRLALIAALSASLLAIAAIRQLRRR